MTNSIILSFYNKYFCFNEHIIDADSVEIANSSTQIIETNDVERYNETCVVVKNYIEDCFNNSYSNFGVDEIESYCRTVGGDISMSLGQNYQSTCVILRILKSSDWLSNHAQLDDEMVCCYSLLK